MHAIDNQPVELSDAELATIHGGGLWSWIKKKVLIPIGNLMPWNQRPSGGDIVPGVKHPDLVFTKISRRIPTSERRVRAL